MEASTGVNVYLRIIWKWAWLILLILAATVGVIVYTSFTSLPLYQSTVRLQVIASDPGDVALFSQVRTSVAQDEISTAQADFIGALRRPVIAWQTIADLNMSISANDLLGHLTAGTEDNFVNINYSSENPSDVEPVVSKQVDNALKYYRESRAKSATVLREFIAGEMDAAKSTLDKAKGDLQQFRLKNNLSVLDREVTAYQDEIRSFSTVRDQAALATAQATKEAELYENDALQYASLGDAAAARNATSTAAYYGGLARDFGNQAAQARIKAQSQQLARDSYDQMIVDRENKLLALITLGSEMDSLQSAVNSAQANYDFLNSKLEEAHLKESQSLNAGFIQVIEAARAPTRAASVRLSRWLMIGGALSVLVGIILAFVLEFIGSYARGASDTRAQPVQD